MTRRITVGLDGKSGSAAAACWAGREAELRAAALDLVHAGQAAVQILDAAKEASLVTVGGRRRASLGTHIGPITSAVMHHASSPVAIVAHD
ncbi:universal stress protein [Streptomyces sp. NPDC055059]|uniref:universal stress protein n=1 Tax=Streptomyces sp. NPDC127172 TaxID=3345382 RepID=UPI00363BE36C